MKPEGSSHYQPEAAQATSAGNESAEKTCLRGQRAAKETEQEARGWARGNTAQKETEEDQEG